MAIRHKQGRRSGEMPAATGSAPAAVDSAKQSGTGLPDTPVSDSKRLPDYERPPWPRSSRPFSSCPFPSSRWGPAVRHGRADHPWFLQVLTWDGEFAGRLRVQAEPAQAGDEGPILRLRLLSRRFVQGRELGSVLAQYHPDIVEGFTAVTTKQMHEIWGRFQ